MSIATIEQASREVEPDAAPRAALVWRDAAADGTKVLGFVEEPCNGPDLPLDFSGTPFRQHVRRVLCTTPFACRKSTSWELVVACVNDARVSQAHFRRRRLISLDRLGDPRKCEAALVSTRIAKPHHV